MGIEDFQPFRFGVAGDWHGNTLYAVDALDYFADRFVDHVVHLGDFGYQFTPEFVKLLTRTLEENDQHLWFIDGNHENQITLHTFPMAADGTKSVSKRIHFLPRGFRWEWNGVKMLGLGGAFSIDKRHRTPGVSWWPEEEINWDDAERVIAGGQADIMFTHDCPSGVEIPDLRRNPMNLPVHVLNQANNHRNLLRQIVDEVKPGKLYHGHYHVKYDSQLWGPDYTTEVHGLDCDGTPLKLNTLIVDL